MLARQLSFLFAQIEEAARAFAGQGVIRKECLEEEKKARRTANERCVCARQSCSVPLYVYLLYTLPAVAVQLITLYDIDPYTKGIRPVETMLKGNQVMGIPFKELIKRSR